MTKNNWLYLTGVLALGVVSSALWEGIKPLTTFVFKFLLNVSTLGLQKFKDDIYREIAKGFHENFSLELYSLVMVMLASMYVGMWFALLKLRSTENTEKTGGLFSFMSERFAKVLEFWILPTIVIIVVVSTALEVVKQEYINLSVTHVNQTLLILEPFLNDEEEELLISQFAQVDNRSDFVQFLNRLEEIADINQIKIPDFDFRF